MAHPKQQQIRRRFEFRCGYCGVTEVDTGGELTVDHFQPVSAGGGEDDDNLIYACWRCNGYKSDFWPVASRHEYRILHPLRDDVAAHIREDPETGRLEPLTETGRAHIELLHLNRSLLIAHRLHLRAAELQEAENVFMDALLALQSRVLAQMDEYLTKLRGQSKDSAPAPSSREDDIS